MQRVFGRLGCAAVLLLACGAAPAQQHPQPVSQAETLLFETDHLQRVQAPTALVYAFSKTGNAEPGFSDQVRLDLATAHGKRAASLQFLSGQHATAIPAVDEPHGNPVLLGFLERDIAEMHHLTGGSANYFRKRIRMALAERAQVARAPVTFGGRTVEGQVVSIQPYLDDPLHERFEKYVHKTYTFVLSDQVPGGVYQLRTSLGAADAKRDGRLVMDETLTLVKAGQPVR